jgi:hypothetical protein
LLLWGNGYQIDENNACFLTAILVVEKLRVKFWQ